MTGFGQTWHIRRSMPAPSNKSVQITRYNSMGWKELTRTYHATMDGRSKTILREQAEDELRAMNEDLTNFNNVVVGRELRMIELKQEVNALCAKFTPYP